MKYSSFNCYVAGKCTQKEMIAKMNRQNANLSKNIENKLRYYRPKVIPCFEKGRYQNVYRNSAAE